MEKECRSRPQEVLKNVESLRDNPPQVILVMDFEGAGKEDAKTVMSMRAAAAALIYHSSLYDGKPKPKICCFAGAHKEGGRAGSDTVRKHLHDFDVEDTDIDTRENTITTNTDIMMLHAYMLKNKMNTAVIITTDWHIPRVEVELETHFKRHIGKFKKHHQGKYIKPTIYVLGPSSKELLDLPYSPEKLDKMKERLLQIEELKKKDPGGGLTEAIAYFLAYLSANRWLKKHLQVPAERFSHPWRPRDILIERPPAEMCKKPLNN